MSTTEENELEKGLIGSKSDDIVLDQEKRCVQFVVQCNLCPKEFDSTATGADPILGLCSLCNINVACPVKINDDAVDEDDSEKEEDVVYNSDSGRIIQMDVQLKNSLENLSLANSVDIRSN